MVDCNTRILVLAVIFSFLPAASQPPPHLIEGDIEHDDFVDFAYGNFPDDDPDAWRRVPGVEKASREGESYRESTLSALYSECPRGSRREIRVERQKRAALFGNERLWPNGVVYFQLEETITPEKEKVIRQAMRHWEDHTCIRFQPRLDEPDYLSFYNGLGCHTAVGRTGGKQGVSINDECKHMGTIAHEIAHAVGFWHEQSRPDRDSYVQILWQNIRKGKEHNFNKMHYKSIDSRGIAYDYNSIMHYGPTSFSLDDTLDTIVPLLNSTLEITMGQRSYLSELDIVQANKMYCCMSGGCRLNPCIRGTCTEVLAKPYFKCTCFDGWYGERCQQNYNKCALRPCVKGRCIRDRKSFGGFRCKCDTGFTGLLCDTNIDDCTGHTCQNGGQCVDGVNTYTCQCPPGFRGLYCEFLACPEGTFACRSVGVCVKESHVCDFNNDCGDWSDETENCGSCRFEEGGMCGLINTAEVKWEVGSGGTPSSRRTRPDHDTSLGTSEGQYVFVEASIQHGASAEAVLETPVYPASGENCVLNFSYHMYGGAMGTLVVRLISYTFGSDDLFIARGNQGNEWRNALVRIRKSFFFKIQFVATKLNDSKGDVALDDIWFLNCHVRNNVDNCRDNGCIHGQCIDDVDQYTCQCNPGYTGRYCELDANDCNTTPCGLHGTCHDEVNGYRCDCAEGYTGPRCEITVRYVCDLEQGLCPPWQHKTADFRWTLGSDQTPSVGTGPPHDHTIGGPGGRYLYLEGSSPQNEGDEAVIEIGPLSQSQNSCLLSFYYHMYGATMGVVRVEVRTRKEVRTVWMKSGDQGNRWQLALIRIGAVTDFAVAIVGVIGSHWESDAALDDIMLGGDCGLPGTDCSAEYCSDHGTCHVSSTNNSARSCKCEEGYGGARCQSTHDTCTEESCGPHGTCTLVQGRIVCRCHPGWEGQQCEAERYNECAEGRPCVFGRCVDLEGGFRCECEDGYVGLFCDIRTCHPNPCLHEGICIPQPRSIICHCQHGYDGRFCQRGADSEADECAETCHNGRCNSNGTCTCLGEYSGLFCNETRPDNSSSFLNTLTSFTVTILSLIF